MNTQLKEKKNIGIKILKIVWKFVPFAFVLLAAVVIIIPFGKKIAAKKAELADRQLKSSTIEKALTNVVTLQIAPGVIMDRLSLPGVAKPWVSLEVVSEIKGRVVNKKIIEGRRVNRGDILAVIDKSDYQNAHDSALASHESALIKQRRLKALEKKNFVTKSELDDADAMVKISKAALENAKLNLNRCKIHSPMKGIVNRVYIENGKFLNPGDPVVQILQVEKLKIEVGIPESDVDDVRKLKQFNMTIDALKGKLYSGEYHYLSKTTDSMARLYNLEIKVDNSDGQILPDMFARVEIVKQMDSKGLAVPMYSLVNSNNQNTGVYVVEEGMRVQFKPVKTGFLSGWQVQILEGLESGDKVVVTGHRMIEDGQKVNVIKNITDIEEVAR